MNQPASNPTPRFNPGHMLSFDLETTGTNPLEARIVTSAMVRIQGSSVQDVELLADPGVEIPEQASAVHGITTDHAREHGKPHDEVLAETIRAIRQGWQEGATLIVFNAPYDLTILRSQDPSFTVDGPVIDPLLLDKHFDPYRRGKRTLGAVCEHYDVALDNAHEATADAIAAARVAWKIAREHPELTSMSADELMLEQSTWYYESQTGLAEYFRKQGRDAKVNTSWPLQKQSEL